MAMVRKALEALMESDKAAQAVCVQIQAQLGKVRGYGSGGSGSSGSSNNDDSNGIEKSQ